MYRYKALLVQTVQKNKQTNKRRYLTAHYSNFSPRHRVMRPCCWLAQVGCQKKKKKLTRTVKVCCYTSNDYERSTLFGWLAMTGGPFLGKGHKKNDRLKKISSQTTSLLNVVAQSGQWLEHAHRWILAGTFSGLVLARHFRGWMHRNSHRWT